MWIKKQTTKKNNTNEQVRVNLEKKSTKNKSRKTKKQKQKQKNKCAGQKRGAAAGRRAPVQPG